MNVTEKLLAIFFVAVVLLMCGCKRQGAHEAYEGSLADSLAVADSTDEDTFRIPDEQNPMPASADELFDDFFFNFIENGRLQRERTIFPLPILADGTPVDTIRKDNWVAESFFLQQGYYTLIVNSDEELDALRERGADSVVVEKVMFGENAVRQHIFKHGDAAWRLCAINVQPLHKNANVDFLTFYHQFSTDSTFQRASLGSAIEFSSPDPDNDFERIEGVITPDTWAAFEPVLPVDPIYNIVYGDRKRKNSHTKIFVIRGISNGEETLLTFKNNDGKWTLIKLDS